MRAIDFDYVKAERIDREKIHPFIPKEYYKLNDPITLMPSLFESSGHVLRELPTHRSTGNKLSIPISVILT